MNMKIGLVDIGSNTVRLVIIENVDGGRASRLIDESKRTIRLANRIQTDGTIAIADINDLANILRYFRLLCEAEQVSQIRAVATAAIRNAANCNEIAEYLSKSSGIPIEIISGEDEARIGFLGIINTIAVERGFVVDIGGGSTEITFFENRSIVESISIPLGAVNSAVINDLRAEVRRHLEPLNWLRKHQGSDLIGLGGTWRTAGKIDQALCNYSFPVIHHYETTADAIRLLVEYLLPMSVEERLQVPNLGKDRADIIGPGLELISALLDATQPNRIIISGSGLRDGLFFETCMPQQSKLQDPAKYTVQSFLALYPPANLKHELQVRAFSRQLFETLTAYLEFDDSDSNLNRLRLCLETAAMLYSIGISINYYQYYKHTFYLLTNARLDGFSHREILLTALIAAHRSKRKTRELYGRHKDILNEQDFRNSVKLGTLLQLAVALDRSKTQPIAAIECRLQEEKRKLHVHLFASEEAELERHEVETLASDIRKNMEVTVKFSISKYTS